MNRVTGVDELVEGVRSTDRTGTMNRLRGDGEQIEGAPSTGERGAIKRGSGRDRLMEASGRNAGAAPLR